MFKKPIILAAVEFEITYLKKLLLEKADFFCFGIGALDATKNIAKMSLFYLIETLFILELVAFLKTPTKSLL